MRRTFIAPHVAELPKSGIRAFFDIVAQRKDVISLGVGEPDFDTPWHVSRAAVTALENGQTHYTSNLGTPELRQAIAAYLKRRFNAPYDWRRQILVTVGVSEAIDLAIRAKVTPRTKALLLNFPCNPTGATLTRADMKAIAKFVLKHDLLLLADEVYSELIYPPKGSVARPMSFASMPELKDHLILLNGFSKSWAMTGYRLGYACGPHDVVDAMMKIHQYGIMSAPTLSQAAGVEAMEHGDEDVARMRAEYRRRRDFLVAALNAAGLKTLLPAGAFYLFTDITSTGLTSQEFAVRLLEEKSVACVPGSAFGACGEGFVRLSYATSYEKIQEAAARISAFARDCRKRRRA